jgi:hypothetical protein
LVVQETDEWLLLWESPLNKIRAFLDTYLDPSEQLTELLVGLIMVLIITTAARSSFVEAEEGNEDAASARKETVSSLQSAMGCNVAWGLITGLMITMNNIYDRSRPMRLKQKLRTARDKDEALAIVQDEMEADLDAITSAEERTHLYDNVVKQINGADMPHPGIQGKDFVAGIIIFFLVVVTAVPAYLPFLFDDLVLGIRIANLILVSGLFVVGYCWGRVVHMNAWGTGFTILVMGVAMVGVGEWLGG